MNTYRIFSEPEARALADKVRDMGWSTGKARTRELEGEGSVKNNSEILNHVVLKSVAKAISGNRDVQLDAIPLKMHPPKFSRYTEGSYYKRHTDAPWMGETRTDLSCTLWLTDGYDGGWLRIGDQDYKGKPGECIIYDCGAPHEVTPVTSGERICVITWIQSRVRDPQKRRLVSDFRKFLKHFEGNQDLFVEGGQIHSALLRMWIES